MIESFGGNGTLGIVKGSDLYGLDVGDKLYTEAEMKRVVDKNQMLTAQLSKMDQVRPPAPCAVQSADLGTKQERYKDSKGKDTIDKWMERYPLETFRVIMWIQMEKYNDRLGKKDSPVEEVRKIADYAARWLQVEEGKL